MRTAFIETLTALAASHPRIVLLTGDLGFGALEVFRSRHPRRFYNVGVAEQNMIGMAIGLAEAGYIPFCYSIATFATMRGYEFIRAACANGAQIRVVGMGGGFEYGTAGWTHHALEDIAIMRALPRMQVIAPCDHRQAASALRATYLHEHPVYYRLGKDDLSELSGLEGHFDPGCPSWDAMNLGSGTLIVSTGAIALEVSQAIGMVEKMDGATIEFRPDHCVVSAFNPGQAIDYTDYELVITVEEHRRNGGLGSWVAEQMAERRTAARLVRIAADEDYLVSGLVGSTGWLRARHRLDAASIADQIREATGEVFGDER